MDIVQIATLGVLIVVVFVVLLLLINGRGSTKSANDDTMLQMVISQQKELQDLKSSLSNIPDVLTKEQSENRKEMNTHIEKMHTKFTESVKEIAKGQQAAGENMDSRLNSTISTINEQLASVSKNLNKQLESTQGNIGKQLSESSKVISEVQGKLGELGETAKQIHEVGKDINRLQDILQAPKLRGNIGELLLEDLLAQIMPQGNYEMQYQFKSRATVDAVIKLGDNMVPIDSKFPLESFNRFREAEDKTEKKKARKEFVNAVKKQVDEIADNYIRPDENTYDFALMYVPAENVYYEMIARSDSDSMENEVLTYAWQRHIIPVSPNSLYAYLMAIAYGLKGMHIEKRAKEIQGRLGEVQSDFSKFHENFISIGKNIRIASEKFEKADRQADRFDDKLTGLTDTAGELGSDDEAEKAIESPESLESEDE